MIKQYLDHYAEPEASLIFKLPQTYHSVLIVPAYNEAITFLDLLANIQHKNVLMILVINAEVDAPSHAVKTNHQLIYQLLRKYSLQATYSEQPCVQLLSTEFGSILWVDRNNDRLPKKTGVGLARKIAADIGLRLILQGNIESPWIYSTDADVQLPTDYFQRIAANKAVANVFPFQHRVESSSPAQMHAMTLYERSLHHYVNGLKQAGSPYAFHTIGSTFAVHAKAYAAVRGFPKRPAGEDFYLLNKLAKIGEINTLSGKPILLDGRISDRVPFGTGQAISRIMQTGVCNFYHDETFDYLKTWVSLINQAPQDHRQALLVMDQTLLVSVLEKLDAFVAIKKIQTQAKTPQQQVCQVHIWFDALKTLRLIHLLRDTAFPSIEHKILTEALDR